MSLTVCHSVKAPLTSSGEKGGLCQYASQEGKEKEVMHDCCSIQARTRNISSDCFDSLDYNQSIFGISQKKFS